jgi:hypothetical protein
MSEDLLIDDEPDIELEPDTDEDIVLEEDEGSQAPGDSAVIPPTPAAPIPSVPNGGDSGQLAPVALMQVLPADFPLPALIKFVPNPLLRTRAEQAAAYALSIEVAGPEGLQRADVALTTLRASQKAIEEHFAEPKEIANRLHKSITGTLSDWLTPGKAAVETVGRKVYQEQRRLDAIAAEERRKAQAEADRIARENARREAEAAAKAQAPAQVVEELKRQAETTTAPPVSTPAATATAMRSSSVVKTWKCRVAGTPADAEANPKMAELSPAQRDQVINAMKAVIAGQQPITLFEVNWTALNARAKAEKSTFAIPGFEAYEAGGVRAKGGRSR